MFAASTRSLVTFPVKRLGKTALLRPHHGATVLCRSSHAASCRRRHDAVFWRNPFSNRLMQIKNYSIRFASTAANQNNKKSSRWHRLAVWIRYTRIPILVFSVYKLGYQQGVIDCTKQPKALTEQILNSILLSTGADQVEIVSETDISWVSRSKHHQVAAVGHKIVSSARDYVAEELQKAMDQVKTKLPPDISEQDALRHYDADEQVQFWYNARLRLQGEDVKNKPWQYIFVSSATPNAFVTEILPQRFFITTAMLNVASTHDELGLVLAHEVSHLLLGHVSQTNQVETFLRTVEVLLLSMDPTVGLLSVAVIASLAAMRKVLSAAHSRENEREADELGCVLAARACFDTQAGSHVLYKMHELHVAAAGTDVVPTDKARLMDTHPPSLERWRFMKKKSETENYTKYADAQCAAVSRRFYRALWGSSD